MDTTKTKVRKLTNEIGTYFFHSFSTNARVNVGTRFTTDNGTRTWVVGRIDSATVVDDLIHVEGYCINAMSLYD